MTVSVGGDTPRRSGYFYYFNNRRFTRLIHPSPAGRETGRVPLGVLFWTRLCLTVTFLIAKAPFLPGYINNGAHRHPLSFFPLRLVAFSPPNLFSFLSFSPLHAHAHHIPAIMYLSIPFRPHPLRLFWGSRLNRMIYVYTM